MLAMRRARARGQPHLWNVRSNAAAAKVRVAPRETQAHAAVASDCPILEGRYRAGATPFGTGSLFPNVLTIRTYGNPYKTVRWVVSYRRRVYSLMARSLS